MSAPQVELAGYFSQSVVQRSGSCGGGGGGDEGGREGALTQGLPPLLYLENDGCPCQSGRLQQSGDPNSHDCVAYYHVVRSYHYIDGNAHSGHPAIGVRPGSLTSGSLFRVHLDELYRQRGLGEAERPCDVQELGNR
ncbi:hypothetical protein HYQ44_018449 [Verticillium longisporum]|nr:hypothetical protein HYQ44_018449 [Verticillium longisporum]